MRIISKTKVELIDLDVFIDMPLRKSELIQEDDISSHPGIVVFSEEQDSNENKPENEDDKKKDVEKKELEVVKEDSKVEEEVKVPKDDG